MDRLPSERPPFSDLLCSAYLRTSLAHVRERLTGELSAEAVSLADLEQSLATLMARDLALSHEEIAPLFGSFPRNPTARRRHLVDLAAVHALLRANGLTSSLSTCPSHVR